MSFDARPVHGGRRLAAAKAFGIPPSEWLDLSTGINPSPWPVAPVAPDAWARLPEPEDGLVEAAAAYYGAASLLPVAGSQAAIQALPQLRPPGRVGVLSPAYAEHAYGWAKAGHELVILSPERIEEALPGLDTLVLVNPNNPTGHRFDRGRLLEWHRRLTARGGWLLVDEAFMDPTPEASLAAEAYRSGLIVLRSLGKFFGLAGARVGFVLAAPELLAQLDDRLGPWTVAGPAREIATGALADTPWQEKARRELRTAGERLAERLAAHGLPPAGGTALFQWVHTERAQAIQNALAAGGIWVRRFGEPHSLRFGLPGREADWERLELALAGLTASKGRCP